MLISSRVVASKLQLHLETLGGTTALSVSLGLLTLRWSEVMFTSSWLLGWSLSNRTVSAPLQYRRILPSGFRTEDEQACGQRNDGQLPLNNNNFSLESIRTRRRACVGSRKCHDDAELSTKTQVKSSGCDFKWNNKEKRNDG